MPLSMGQKRSNVFGGFLPGIDGQLCACAPSPTDGLIRAKSFGSFLSGLWRTRFGRKLEGMIFFYIEKNEINFILCLRRS
jgi:hypothetical protein